MEFEENVNPEDYTRGITEERDCLGNSVWRSFSNPEHILDMVYEGPLYMLLTHDTYETRKSEISEEAWEEYQEFVNGEVYETGEDNLTPTYQRYGTYEEYMADME